MLRYRPEIDGLRAVAVLPVLMFHLGCSWLPGGFLGVDVFFVISGYLITSILKREFEENRFSARSFWGRRIRRLLPSLVLVCFCTTTVAWLATFRADAPEIGWQSTCSLLSCANVFFWRVSGNYWGKSSEESPLLHCWSLSIEEQFYLTFPLLLWLFYRKKRNPKTCFLLLSILSGVLFLLGARFRPVPTFYLLPTRAWELATGAYLAYCSKRHIGYPGGRCWDGVGLGMILGAYLISGSFGLGAVVAVLGAALVIHFAEEGIARSLLSCAPLVFIGKISYSLYLWHWPIIVYAKYFGYSAGGSELFLLLLLPSLLGYAFVESPARRARSAVPVILLCYLFVLLLSIALGVSDPHYDTSQFRKPHWYGLYYDVGPINPLPDDFRRIVETVDLPARGGSATAYKEGGILVGPRSERVQVVVLGDSHGAMWSNAIREALDGQFKAAFISINAVSPLLRIPVADDQATSFMTSSQKSAYDRSRIALITAWRPKVIIVCCKWSNVNVDDATDLLRLAERSGSKVLLMEQPPELQGIGNRNLMEFLIYKGIQPGAGVKRFWPFKVEARLYSRRLVDTLCSSHTNTQVIPVFGLFANKSEALVLDSDNVVFLDDDHLTTYGASLATKSIRKCILESLDSP